ncbi:MAG TPA: hypothetical protein VJR89_41045 [Polyangiales bacterium]|nr:hypothetical protein [Polyangiales bacterium]
MEDKARLAQLQRELQLIRELREELDLKGTLARAGTRADWDMLEDRFQAAQEELARFEEHRASTHELERAATSLLEVRRGYERLPRH